MTRRAPERLEFVVPPELAEVAERLGLPLHVGQRVRLEIVDVRIDGAPVHQRSSDAPPAVPRPRNPETGAVVSDRSATLRRMTEADDAYDPVGGWDPRRRAVLERLWARFEVAGGGTDLGDQLIAERRREADAEDGLVSE